MSSVCLLLILVLSLLGTPGNTPAAEVQIFLPPNGIGLYAKKVKSYRELRMSQVVPQTVDFSCGAAALATLLRYHFGNHMTERDVILGMFDQGDKEQIKKMGFSMLEMKRFAEQLHYQGEGYKIDMQKLREIDIPVITLMNTRNYKHFVVIRRVDDRFVYIADPSFGNRRMTWGDFEAAWNRIVFVVTGTVTGHPEGLYVEKVNFTLPKYQAVRRPDTWQRFAMDPSMALIWSSRSGISLVNLINAALP